ncbi:MAG TPA: CDP-alcohol phosphatidyltransferase family protein [Paludibacter sp.]|nr:CDP-alcohol phosphatidyltransferase family protein [Paludibacter sp.]
MNSELESSLKSIETENYIDRIFFRPVGFIIAKALKNTGITPNMVTIFSIFVGSAAGIFFYFPYSISFALLGILFLIMANILDCVDGQLARLTGIKSEIGRILDGFAGDFWFFLIYIAFIHRSNIEFDTWLFIPVAFLAAYNHTNQAGLTDYYKTLHLMFVNKDKGKEFESSESIKARVAKMPKGVNKFFSRFYILYTINQERQTPELQKMLKRFKEKYGDNLPDDVRLSFKAKSLKLMPLLDILTFNGRTIVLFISVLFNVVWVYLFWEIVVLAAVKIIAQRKHEKICKSFE